jgi:hypothetical protein
MATIPQLISSIDSRLAELHVDTSRLQAARSELVADGAAQPAPAAPAATRPVRRRRPRAARTAGTEVAPAGKLHKLLSESDGGLTTQALAQLANAEPAQVLALLREMEADGGVLRTGQRRGTRWHAADSEETWVSQRAAELAARSRNR